MNIYRQIYENNIDLLERLSDKNYESHYLKNEDVFLMKIGKSNLPYDSIELDDLMTIHYDPDTFKITGFTISYMKEFRKAVATMKREKEIHEEYQTPSPQSVASASLFGLSLAYTR